MRPLTNVTSLLSLNAALENSTTTNLPSRPNLSLYTPRIPLNETVFLKVRETMTQFSSATFRELQVTSKVGPTTDPELLLHVRLYFSYSDGSMYADMADIWGTWKPPRFSVAPFYDPYNALPARLGMDILFADQLIKRAGFVGPYRAVDVKWPKVLRLGKEQPYYCFFMEGNQPEIVFVGLNDQSVMTSLPMVEEDLEINGPMTV